MSDEPPSLVIHIAGADVKIGPRLRQRCAWCGALIDDVDLSTVGFVAGSDQTYPTWPVGALVAVGDGITFVVEHVNGTDVPRECCASLDPEVTK